MCLFKLVFINQRQVKCKTQVLVTQATFHAPQLLHRLAATILESVDINISITVEGSFGQQWSKN